MRRYFGFNTTESVNAIGNEPSINTMLMDNDMVTRIVNLINSTIEQYSIRIARGEKKHFFRISRAMSDVYEKDPVT